MVVEGPMVVEGMIVERFGNEKMDGQLKNMVNKEMEVDSLLV